VLDEQSEELSAAESAQSTLTISTSQRLWNAAYDSLKEKEDTALLVRSYVKTLTAVLGTEADVDTVTKLENPTNRQAYMERLVREGQARVSTAIKITKRVGATAEFILSAKKMVDLAVQSFPQAALPWAGVCIGLQVGNLYDYLAPLLTLVQMLSDPAKATKANLAGITHVVSRMHWYCALATHLVGDGKPEMENESFQPILRQLEEKILALYKALLTYQMKSVYSYYRNQGLVFLRGLFRSLANLDDWDGDLKTVTDAEASLLNDWDMYDRLATRSLGSSLRNELVRCGDGVQSLLNSIHQTLSDYIALQKGQADDRNAECLRSLYVVNPQDDMARIESNKDELLYGTYEWISRTDAYTAFTSWTPRSTPTPCRLLWIKGHAGTGKTMLLIGIIRRLSDQSAALAPSLAYFFCQGTGERKLNTAAAALKCLMWMLLVQQPHLITHLQSEYKHSGAALFSDGNEFYALYRIFLSMLKDPLLSPAYLIVDALDECEQGLDSLIELIARSLTESDQVRWLVSSRPEVDVLAKLNLVFAKLNLDTSNLHASESLVELDTQSLQQPVNAYIDHKLSILGRHAGYEDDTIAEVSNLIRQRAMNTFLWVALVFKELDGADGGDAISIIEDIPPGLTELYSHIMSRIEKTKRRDPEYCRNVLAATVLAYRPLSLSELAVLAGLPSKTNPQVIVTKCGSFLTIAGDTVSLIHQSAGDYLRENYTTKLQSAGIAQSHIDVTERSLKIMSETLRRDIYDLRHPGVSIDQATKPSPDPLALVRYSCVYWVDHLVEFSKCRGDGNNIPDEEIVHTFFRKKYLHWLEALSLLRSLSAGVLSMEKLEGLLQVRFMLSLELRL